MTTKERIIRQTIKKVQAERNRAKYILEADPYSSLCELYREAKIWMEDNPDDVKNLSEKYRDKVAEWAKCEKTHRRIIRQQRNSSKLIAKVVTMDFELTSLNRELYCIERYGT